MALMTAPYNSAMRLGMGFNSYTQTLCVNDVVRRPGGGEASESDLRAVQLTQRTDAATTTTTTKSPPPRGVLQGATGSVKRTIMDGQKEVSQIVSWSAEFIENSSDVLQKLDVSGTLSIKMAGLGSLSGKGSFVDSTEIKKADINYLVHVKVVNQRLTANDITEFCPIDHVEPGQFTDIYGDCFISGFIEGGEFDAIVSITTEATMKKNGISGQLALSATIGGIDIEGSAKGDKTDNSTSNNARTKISVTWSGGGDIRDDSIQEWTLKSLKEVAMGFPDAVAACPQRISAILTKYTALRSFHEHTKKGSPLDYENAGVYTAALYDAYTDYKIMWKEIQAMTTGLNRRDLTLRIQEAPQGLKSYADEILKIQGDKETKYKTAIAAWKESQNSNALVPITQRSQALEPIEPLPANKVIPYPPDIFGLDIAARDCRFEMIKIVREVDAVTRDPHVASDPSRTAQYLSPSVFKLLLPTPDDPPPTREQWTDTKKTLQETKDNLRKKEIEVEDRDRQIREIKRKLEAALITTWREENNTLSALVVQNTAEVHPDLENSLSKHAYKADNFRMQSFLMKKESISTDATFFNDLDDLEPDVLPSELRLWSDSKRIEGICVVYMPNKQIAHGKMQGNPQHVLKLDIDEVITELEVHVVKGTNDKSSVTAISVATSKCNILTVGTKSTGATLNFSRTEDHHLWSFRGFFGFTFADGFEDLGIIWGKHDHPSTEATNTVQKTPAKHLLGMSPSLLEKTKKAMSETKPAEHFYLGGCVETGPLNSSPNSFSALDTIVGSSRIREISFSSAGGRLTGLKVEYSDGKKLAHGASGNNNESWSCEVQSPIVAAKLTVAKSINAPESFVDTVELVCGNDDGELPLWPLDVSTVRYLGDHKEDEKLEVVAKSTEQAPKFGHKTWSLRGFYGEEAGGLITKLGLVWGCA